MCSSALHNPKYCISKARQLFTFLDYNESGCMDFLEVVSGLALLSPEAPCDRGDRVALAFRIYDSQGCGHVMSANIIAMHERIGELPDGLEQDLRLLQDSAAGFTFEAFCRLLQRRPALLEPPLKAAQQRLSTVVGEEQWGRLNLAG